MAESEKDKLNFAKQRLEVEKEIAQVSGRSIGTNFSNVESIKEILNLNKQKTEFDREILRGAKDLNEQITKNITGLTTINKLNNSIKITQAKINRSREFSQSVINTLTGDQQQLIQKVLKLQTQEELQLSKAADIQKNIDRGYKDRITGEEEVYELRFKALEIETEIDDIIQNQLDNNAKIVLASQGLEKSAENQLNKNKAIKEALDDSGAGFIEMLSLIPGFGGVAQKQLELINENLEDVVSGDTSITEFKEQISVSSTISKTLFNRITLLGSAALQLFAAFQSINKQQTLLRRNIGDQLKLSKVLNSEFAVTSELLEQANSLVEQFGFNVQDAFNEETLKSATELTVAVGLTAEESGRLALFSTVSGDNLERQLESAVKQVNPLISARQILQQVGNISNFIAINFDNNVTALTRAASEAKELGLQLSQVDKIADNLLDIESSITSEFEARIITGQDLNLNMARFYALNNDLVGVTREIGNNQKIINTFAGNNRVAQQAIADALGLSRDEIADMIQEQSLLNSMSDKQRKAKELSDIKAIENQEKLRKAFQRFFESFAVLAEPIVTFLTSITSVLNVVAGGINAISGIFKGQFMKDLTNFLSIAAIAAGFIFGGPVGGFAAMGVLAGIGGAKMLLGNDMISPGYGKRTLLAPEGAIALNNDDTVIAGTRLGRNAGLSRSDIKAIAAAVRDGASQANINLDGGRVSSRLQVPNVINQRQYSI